MEQVTPRSESGYCLVLSGGGAKGVYHLGVWRALKEAGLEVEALIGTSIGAIMAAFLAQGAEEALEGIVQTMALESIVEFPPDLDTGSLPAVAEFAKSLMEKRGIDTSPMRRTLTAHLDEGKLRRCGVDLGFVTVNLSDLTPREVFLDEIAPGRLVDFLMASAAFPGLEPPVIDGKRYLDGGLYDNVPYATARARGYTRIIVSDASGIGVRRRLEVEGSLTLSVRSSQRMGGTWELDQAFLQDYQQLGYLDALKALGRLVGHHYFVEPDPAAESASTNRAALPPRFRLGRHRRLARLECAAVLLDVPRLHRYTYETLADAIERRRVEEDGRIAAFLGEQGMGRRALAALLRSEITAQSFRGCPYHTWRLLERLLPGKAGNLLRRTLEGTTPEFPVGLEYLDGSTDS